MEYGRDEIAGWIRTEKVNPHLISVRLGARGPTKNASRDGRQKEVRRVAYLLDAKTISILNLPSQDATQTNRQSIESIIQKAV